ncbi:ABC transporter permease [Schaalia suimastitidis]|uniref:ABC transporter permease n=1 Tax=Schaalia suimastitidis TaxID=121163 RepID=UPI000401E7E1|nr:ABC transporter permease subunit [Schaalia suimastitidis]
MNWLMHNWLTIGALLSAHLSLVVPSLLLSALIAVPLGRWAGEGRKGSGVLLRALSLMYAIPSLPLLVTVPIIIGTGLRSPVNMVLVLTIYGVSILVGHSAKAFSALPHTVLEAADAIGMTRLRRFFTVELPLATPTITAGMRVLSASTVSLVTVGAVIGIQSLGTLFTDGFQRGITIEIIAGIISTALLALFLDVMLIAATHLVTPWRRTEKTSGQ